MKSATAISFVAAALMLGAAAFVSSSTSAVSTSPPLGVAQPLVTPVPGPAPAAPPSGQVVASVSSVDVRAAVDRPLLLPGERDAWLLVDVAGAADATTSRSPVAMAVVIDTSGSMSGDRIDYARSAARDLVASLQPGDRVSIVAYADGASVLAGNVEVGRDRSTVLAAIERMRADGSTCMSCGMDEGYRQLAQAPDGHVARMIILSDGHANRGMSDPARLATRASLANDAGAATTTIGVGRDYNEALMSGVATAGSGSYYFLAEPASMARVLERERSALERTVARDVLLTIMPTSGVTVAPGNVVGASASGDGVVVRIGQLASGQHRELLLPMQVGADTLDDAVRITVTFVDGAGDEQGTSTTLAMARTNDAAAATAAENVQVVVARERVASANRLEDAMAALAAGDTEGATASLELLDRDLEEFAAATEDDDLRQELDRVRSLRGAVSTGRVAGGGAEARDLYLQNQARAQEANVGVPAADAMYDDVFAR